MRDDIVLGTRQAWDAQAPFYLSPQDRRRHLLVIGQTGTGKTTLLRNMIAQDIAAGRGVAFIDPHGDAATELLDLVPPHRVDDVVYFDPSDTEHPIGFNLLGQVPPERRPLVASGIVSVFKSVWADSWGPRLEYILYAAVSALLDCENVTLLGLPRMLSDDSYRAWVVKQVKDPFVRSFWEREFANYERRFMQEAIAPIQNKVGQLLMSPLLRNILGQVRSRVDPRALMDQGKIFIANLSKGKLGDSGARLLGSLWVTQFQLAAMSRADMPEEKRRDYAIFADEYPSFVNDSFAAILSEARKYRLNIVLGTQYRTLTPERVLAAIDGNVGSIVSFRVGHEDAEDMSAAFDHSYPPRAFTGLSNGEVYVKILSQGETKEPFQGRTLPPWGRHHGRGETVVQRSRMNYSTARATVERKIASWFERLDGR